ncbi:MAG: DUF1016 N-terminal domain-containing protein [Lentisphaeria bacterium]|nr:DUF1016 N-terminal domain-containing protein [Lentisphaeria bacterium]
MLAFAREYPDLGEIVPQAVAQLEPLAGQRDIKMPQAVALSREELVRQSAQQLAIRIPWGHNVWLIERVKELPARAWYMRQTIEQGWSRSRCCPPLKKSNRNSAERMARMPLQKTDQKTAAKEV